MKQSMTHLDYCIRRSRELMVWSASTLHYISLVSFLNNQYKKNIYKEKAHRQFIADNRKELYEQNYKFKKQLSILGEKRVEALEF